MRTGLGLNGDLILAKYKGLELAMCHGLNARCRTPQYIWIYALGLALFIPGSFLICAVTAYKSSPMMAVGHHYPEIWHGIELRQDRLGDEKSPKKEDQKANFQQKTIHYQTLAFQKSKRKHKYARPPALQNSPNLPTWRKPKHPKPKRARPALYQHLDSAFKTNADADEFPELEMQIVRKFSKICPILARESTIRIEIGVVIGAYAEHI